MSSIFGYYGASNRRRPFSPFDDAIDPSLRSDDAGALSGDQKAVEAAAAADFATRR